MKKLTENKWVALGLGVVFIGGIAGGATYLAVSNGRIYTDSAIVNGHTASLVPAAPGILQETMVRIGDRVPANTVVARVGTQLIKTKTDSVVTDVDTAIGSSVGPTTPVVTVVDPSDLRVVAHIDEDKGFDSIELGDQVVFTIDAFGSKKFQGVVDQISPAARQEDVVFNISDKRQTNQFDVRIRFDTDAYPEIKNGMSARVWIYVR